MQLKSEQKRSTSWMLIKIYAKSLLNEAKICTSCKSRDVKQHHTCAANTMNLHRLCCNYNDSSPLTLFITSPEHKHQMPWLPEVHCTHTNPSFFTCFYLVPIEHKLSLTWECAQVCLNFDHFIITTHSFTESDCSRDQAKLACLSIFGCFPEQVKMN